MKKRLDMKSPSSKIFALFFLPAFTILLFGWFFAMQLHLHNSVYKKDIATISKDYPSISFAHVSETNPTMLGERH